MGMSKRELKKDHLLDAGMAVMATHGYNGTSIKDIVDAAEVPKGSFYTYFRSKEDFALAALERATEERARQARALLQDRNLPPLERLSRYFRDFAGNCDGGVTGGCFIGNMCQEMSDTSEAIRLKVRELLCNNTLSIEDLLEEARLDGSLSSPMDSRVLAEFLFNAWEGTVMRMKASKSREPMDAFLAALPAVVGQRVDSAA